MKKTVETFFYSTIGVVAVGLILIAFNFIAARAHQRIDLTAEKAHTLSAGTKAILGKARYPGADPLLLHEECVRHACVPDDLCAGRRRFAR